VSGEQVREEYARWAAPLVEGGVLTDPWYEGEPRFDTEPIILGAAQHARLLEVAESLAAAWGEALNLCAEHPEWLGDFFQLTPYQKLMWASSAPFWHGFARVDLFETAAGVVACELNCDTPTGQAEAALLSERALRERPGAGLRDANAGLEAAFLGVVEALSAAFLTGWPEGETPPRNVGLVYPTELTEDLPLIRLYTAWLERAGYQVVLGSPFNLRPGPLGGVSLFGVDCPVILRHYKTDWWGEREVVWTDEEPYVDREPLASPLGLLIEASASGQCAVLNPFGAVVGQSKKVMALLWEKLELLSPHAQATVRAHLPLTLRLEAIHQEQLFAQREEWVLKSDYGCEGAEVVVGRLCTPEEWKLCLEKAAPGRFVVQRYFEAQRRENGDSVNLGVYLYGGRAGGVYCRTQQGATDLGARSAACLVRERDDA
jgi:hypothetical protein